jgi:hypothetical protein
MICPYCQHELDVETMSCLRCGAEYPRRGHGLGMGARAFALTGAMLLVFSVMLVDCVLNHLPGGVDSTMPTGSDQLPYQLPPNLKSADVNQLLSRWAAGQQNASQPLPQFITKK